MARRFSVTTETDGGAELNPLDVQAEIDPLHLYLPIDDVTHTTLVGGKVSVLKDIGRGTARDLSQSVDANRFTHGVDAAGKEFMSAAVDTIWVEAATAADWAFMSNPGAGCTMAGIVDVDDVSTGANTIFSCGESINDVGAYFRINGDSGTTLAVHNGAGGATHVLFMPVDVVNNGSTGIYSFVCRWRDSAADFSSPEDNQIDGILSVNDVDLLVSKPRISDYTADATSFPLRVGAIHSNSDNGLIGKLYELAADDRWWSNEMVSRYHARAVSEYGAGNMIR